ncbi:hypothetical protein [Okeania sp. SIO3I5]|nr:hypothetical protein [Okeania sp. SIO3I5]
MKRLLFNSNQREIPSSPLQELQPMKKNRHAKGFSVASSQKM